MTLAIPYYKQTSGFTCGAASLAMALHALRKTPLTRGFEFELWREATMVGVPGIDAWGLSVPALRRDVPVTIVAESETTFSMVDNKRVVDRFGEEAPELAAFNQAENCARARALGVLWEKRTPTAADVEEALAAGRVPILLVDLAKLGDYAAPHWVVVTESAGGTWVVHDPDADGPGVRKLSREAAWLTTDVSDYGAAPALVLLGP